MRLNKKGQLQDLTTVAVGIAVLAITLVITFLVIAEGESQAIDIASATTTNETVAGWARNGTTTAFTFGSDSLADSVSCVAVYNSSDGSGTLVGSGNYSCSNSGIIFLGDNSTGSWNYTGTVIYTHTEPTYAINSSRSLAGAVDDVPGWVPLIVIAVIGSILLGLVALFRR